MASQGKQITGQLRFPSGQPVADPRQTVQTLYHQGQVPAAIARQLEIINQPHVPAPQKSRDFMLLGALFQALGDHAAALGALSEGARLQGDDPVAQENLGVGYLAAEQYEAALAAFLKAHALGRQSTNLLDGLAQTLAHLGRHPEAAQWGRQSLRLKDAEATAALRGTLPAFPPRPAFDPSQKARNVIAYSLWGQQPRYLRGAVANAQAARYLYPTWTCRFYCDNSVPEAVRQQLLAQGAEVRLMPDHRLYEGLLWRFGVMDDTGVDFYLIRDADSLLNMRERVAVDEWLASDKHFHAMRDFSSHSELLLAGMWGGTARVLPPLGQLQQGFQQTMENRTLDQVFLRYRVWPLIRHALMVHDSQLVWGECRPFPALGSLPPGCHVGQSLK